jgi:long-chain fatty acid transport protein
MGCSFNEEEAVTQTSQALRAAAAAVLVTFVALPAFAQSDVNVNASIQFDFINPGARSLGMGGAYRGVADDATAAVTNPAGLRFLTLKEASIEFRPRAYSTEYAKSGRWAGTATGIGADTTTGLVYSTANSSVAALNFLSFVYPIGRWRFAGFRHEQMHFETSIQSDGLFIGDPSLRTRMFPYIGTIDISIVGYGASAAYAFSDKFSLGAGVTYYQFKIDSLTQRYDFTYLYETADFASDNIVNQQTQKGDEWKAAGTVGFAWTAHRMLQIGGVYKQGAKFGYSLQAAYGTASSSPGQTYLDTTGTFTMPDTVSVGVLLRPADPLKVAVDYTFVRYSQISDGFTTWLPPSTGVKASDYTVDDANELHVGVEYGFLKMKHPIFVRGGYWYDPDHKIRYEGTYLSSQALFQAGSGTNHGSFGAGIAANRHFEINGAYDYSKPVQSGSISAVFRF